MTFEEKLDRARTGSRAAYESLCLSSVDGLYTAAIIALKDEKTAKAAVISAINDGYAGISRIRDERHLRSWLVHELTKNAVDRLKEFKASGITHTANGVFADTGKMPDVERLVFSMACVFGYGAREISVLTGMSEDTISDKLGSAKKRLGAAYGSICASAGTFRAPDALRDRYTGFDEAAASYIPSPEEQKPAEQLSAEQQPTEQQPEEQEAVEPTDSQPVEPDEQQPTEQQPDEQQSEEQQPVEPTDSQPVEPDEQSGEDESAFTYDEPLTDESGDKIAAEETDEDKNAGNEPSDKPGFDEETEEEPEYYDDNDEADDGIDDNELVFSELGETQEETPIKLNAETFIAVVSAEKMKGREFLRLIGNTRISNSAYREIEQNPRLTKKRLIELLEESPLTESDYYKLLTAVKERREVLDAKEENRLALERAGLYDGSRREKYRRKRREKPKTDLELAIGINKSVKPERPLTFEESSIAEDETDFQLRNSTGKFEQQKLLNERRHPEKQIKDIDLGSMIGARNDGYDAVDPMSHAALHELFDDNDYEPVDPYAAINANAAGKQSLPERIDIRRDEPEDIEDADVDDDDRALFATTELETPQSAAVSDTRPFDAVSGGIIPDYEATDEASASLGNDDEQGFSVDEAVPEFGEAYKENNPGQEDDTAVKVLEAIAAEPLREFEQNSDSEETITTSPIQNGVSVTQIISDYAIGENVSDEEAERAVESEPYAPKVNEPEPNAPKKISEVKVYEPKVRDPEPYEPRISRLAQPVQAPSGSAGFAPDVGLALDAASDAMDSYAPDDLSFSFDDKDDADDDNSASAKHQRERHQPRHAEDAAAEPKDDDPAEKPHKSAQNDDDGGFGDEDTGRKRYKGNEYFIDDNEYYEGVNRGKIITCAVLAVLLAAGSAGMKYLPFASDRNEPETNDTSITEETTAPAAEITETSVPEHHIVPEEATLTKLSSYDDMSAGSYEAAEIRAADTIGYLRASAEPFPSDIVFGGAPASVLFTDDTAYIYSVQNDCTFRAVPIGEQVPDEQPDAELAEETVDTDTDDSVAPEEPTEETEADADTARVDGSLMHAFTAIDGDLYIVCGKADTKGTELYETQVLVYGKDMSKKAEYSVGGIFTGAGIVDGKLTIATAGSVNGYTEAYNSGLSVSKHPYCISSGKLCEIDASDIYAIDGAKHNAVNILYTVGGDALAVFGGNAGFVKFGGQGMTLAVPDGGTTYGMEISKDLSIVSANAYAGDAFSADCIGQGGMIGQTENGICAYKNGKSVTVPDEKAASVAWSDNGTAYVVTEQNGGQKMLYGFAMSGDSPESAQIAATDIYTDKLIKAGDNLVGLRAEPAPDGERAGLRISMYEYNGALKETAYSIIELDKQTPRENLKYLSSPAETLPTFIGTNEDGTLFAVPTIYFDGYSEVERVVVLHWDGTLFTVCGEYITYDEKSSVLCAAIRNGKLFVITDTKVAESELTVEE